MYEAWQLGQDLVFQNAAEPRLEGADTHVTRRQGGPDALRKKLFLRLVALCDGAIAAIIVSILENMPTKPKIDVLVLGQFEE